MRLITAKEASEILAIRLPRLYELVRLNVVPYVRLGPRQLRFDPERLAEWSSNGGASDTNLNGGSEVSNAQAT